MSDKQLAGRGWAFPVQFHPPGQGPMMVEGDEEIRQALEILITTALGERAMRPGWGSPLPDFLFTELEHNSLALLSEKLSNTLINHEPRINLEAVEIDDSGAGDGLLLLNIRYVLRETNARDNLVYPFYLLETQR